MLMLNSLKSYLSLIRETVRADYALVVLNWCFWVAWFIFAAKVHVVQAKSFREALIPLKLVKQWPSCVAFHIHSIFNRWMKKKKKCSSEWLYRLYFSTYEQNYDLELCRTLVWKKAILIFIDLNQSYAQSVIKFPYILICMFWMFLWIRSNGSIYSVCSKMGSQLFWLKGLSFSNSIFIVHP